MEETSVEVIERVPVPPANQLVPLQEKAGHMETTGVVVPVATHTWLTVPDTEVTVPEAVGTVKIYAPSVVEDEVHPVQVAVHNGVLHALLEYQYCLLFVLS